MKFAIFYIVAISLSSVTSFNISETKLLPQGRIAKGQQAAEGQFPYMAFIYFYPINEAYGKCGGSLIGKKWILTTAHCLKESKLAYVYLGATDKRYSEIVHTVSSENFIKHPDFNAISLHHDIALIQIPFTDYTSKIKPVHLPSFAGSHETYSGTIARISGWGANSEHNTASVNHLQWAELKVIENSLCAQSYIKGAILPSKICTAIESGVFPCTGDSGGPLVLKSTSTQIGIVSFFSRLGCQKGIPIGFTRVTSYLKWIKHHTGISY